MTLKKYNVTVRRFDPTKNINDDGNAENFVLPVDSPDEEHAMSAAMSNCIAFTPKMDWGSLKSVAFCAIAVNERKEYA